MVSKCPHKLLEEENFSIRKKYSFVHLGHWTHKFWPLSENLVRVCQNCIPHSLWNFSMKNFYWTFFSIPDTLRRYFGVLSTKWQCRQKRNLRIQRNIWRVVFEETVFSSFSDIEWQFFDLLSTIFREVFKSAIFVYRWSLRGNSFFLEKVYSLFIFGHCANNFWSSGRFFCRNCRISFYVSEGFFWVKILYGKKFCFD